MKKIIGPGKSFQWEKVLDGKPSVPSSVPATHLAWSESQCPQVVYDLHKYNLAVAPSPPPQKKEKSKEEKKSSLVINCHCFSDTMLL